MTRGPDITALPLEFLGIAEGKVFREPVKVQTLLGSCVAVTMHCRVRKAGGIFHGLLPTGSEFDGERPGVSPYRFLDFGVQALYDALAAHGVDMRGVEAKVFGGAGTLGKEAAGVGLKNVRSALDALTGLGIRVAAVNVGGRKGRKVFFLPHSGEVYVRALSGPHPNLLKHPSMRRIGPAR